MLGTDVKEMALKLCDRVKEKSADVEALAGICFVPFILPKGHS